MAYSLRLPKNKWADHQMLLPESCTPSPTDTCLVPMRPFDKGQLPCSGSITVNFLQHLFHPHPQPDRRSASFYDWPGQSGSEYHYEIHALGTGFKPLLGIYIYAKELTAGDWSPIYIAQTRDLHQRLEGHVTLTEAMANGATHLHAHYCNAGPSARYTEERDLVQRWQPVCNETYPA